MPRFLQACVDAVDKRGRCGPLMLSVAPHDGQWRPLMVSVSPGLQMDGIYRISGNLATIQKLRFIVDQGLPRPLGHLGRMLHWLTRQALAEK